MRAPCQVSRQPTKLLLVKPALLYVSQGSGLATGTAHAGLEALMQAGQVEHDGEVFSSPPSSSSTCQVSSQTAAHRLLWQLCRQGGPGWPISPTAPEIGVHGASMQAGVH